MLNRKNKGVYIEPPFDPPNQIDPERLIVLTKLLIAGREEVIEEIIMGHVRLAMKMASQFVFANPQDMASSALFGLVIGCQKVMGGALRDDNITGFLIGQINSECTNSLRDHRKHLGEKRKRLQDTEAVSTKLAEIQEGLVAAIQTQLEWDIIDLRKKGYTDTEIGVKLKWSQKHIWKTRTEVQARYEQTENGSEG